jgi:hypothetical protein
MKNDGAFVVMALGAALCSGFALTVAFFGIVAVGCVFLLALLVVLFSSDAARPTAWTSRSFKVCMLAFLIITVTGIVIAHLPDPKPPLTFLQRLNGQTD